MAKKDYYEILGVGREAGDPEIKQAYRKLALRFHPDRNPDDPSAEENFKQASEAYSVLSDGQKRATYDRFGHLGLQGAAAQNGFNPEAFTDFSDILGDLFGFKDMFGGGGGQRRSRAHARFYAVDLRRICRPGVPLRIVAAKMRLRAHPPAARKRCKAVAASGKS